MAAASAARDTKHEMMSGRSQEGQIVFDTRMQRVACAPARVCTHGEASVAELDRTGSLLGRVQSGLEGSVNENLGLGAPG